VRKKKTDAHMTTIHIWNVLIRGNLLLLPHLTHLLGVRKERGWKKSPERNVQRSTSTQTSSVTRRVYCTFFKSKIPEGFFLPLKNH